MHRTEGEDYVLESGKRRSRAAQPPTIRATRLPAELVNAIQEEICNVIEKAGLTLNASASADRTAAWDQLWEALTTRGIIGTAAIANDSIDSSKLKQNSVTSSEIALGAVGEYELANEGVKTAALGPGAVTAAKIGGGEVSRFHLAAESRGGNNLTHGFAPAYAVVDSTPTQGENYCAITTSGDNTTITDTSTYGRGGYRATMQIVTACLNAGTLDFDARLMYTVGGTSYVASKIVMQGCPVGVECVWTRTVFLPWNTDGVFIVFPTIVGNASNKIIGYTAGRSAYDVTHLLLEALPLLVDKSNATGNGDWPMT